MLVTIFAPANVHLLQVAGIKDALFEANCKARTGPLYCVRPVTEEGAPIASASGVKLVPTLASRAYKER